MLGAGELEQELSVERRVHAHDGDRDDLGIALVGEASQQLPRVLAALLRERHERGEARLRRGPPPRTAGRARARPRCRRARAA
ncbi:MAG: hypothetical protein M5U28_28350 [Sandaracinaceae bacterium]|nr:hypothetical protein [Sandaracinaceae bacterium]